MNWFFTVMTWSFIPVGSAIGTIGLAWLGLTLASVFPGRPPSPYSESRPPATVFEKKENTPSALDSDQLRNEIRMNAFDSEYKTKLMSEKKTLISSSWNAIERLASDSLYLSRIGAPKRALDKIEYQISIEHEFRKTEVLSIERLAREITTIEDEQRVLTSLLAAPDAARIRGRRQLGASSSRTTAIGRTKSPSTTDSETGSGEEDS